MKVSGVILSVLFSSALAAPAIVWKSEKDASSSVVHHSKTVDARSLLADAVNVPSDPSSLSTAIFLLGRDQNGSERLTELASAGALSGVASKYDEAHSIHHHVAGIEAPHTMASHARNGLAANSGGVVMEISLSEFSRKMTSLKGPAAPAEVEVTESGFVSKQVNQANRREKALAQADVVIVNVAPTVDAATIDQAVVNAIENAAVKNVVLAGIRSTNEVKHERFMAGHRRMSVMQQAENGRRRLEDAQDDDENANGDNDDMTGVYYVSMTPNIFAGILFFLFFAFVAWTGIGCMGQIKGQDLYVKKMPSVGREA